MQGAPRYTTFRKQDDLTHFFLGSKPNIYPMLWRISIMQCAANLVFKPFYRSLPLEINHINSHISLLTKYGFQPSNRRSLLSEYELGCQQALSAASIQHSVQPIVEFSYINCFIHSWTFWIFLWPFRTQYLEKSFLDWAD